MKIAIIGAGLAGVSLAWHLISSGSCEVAVFDHNGVAGGASSIASGLMHPYPGELGRRSFMATEGMGATRQLLTIAQAKSSHPITAHPGIIRFMQNPEQHELFLTHEKEFGDVELYQKDAFLISSGMTIFCQRYLDGLWSAAAERGALLERKEIKDLQELSSYDQIIIAAGAGLKLFPEAQGIHVSFLKGQILTCAIPEHVEFPQQSIIGKGYIAHAEDPRCCYVGSTYERGQLSALPDRGGEVAMAHILLKIAAFYPARSPPFPLSTVGLLFA